MTLTPDDDNFHPPTRDDASWTETCWFAAQVPERGLGIWLYPLFRPKLSIMSCGVYVWETGREELWELPYYRTYWHLPFPEGQQLTDLKLSNGLAYRRVEPLTRFEMTYQDGDAISVELEFEGLHPPHEHGVRDGIGHIDQLGRLRGEIVLYGETIPVDSYEMRDRTWGPRREARQKTTLAYDYGVHSPTSAFHCSTLYDRERREYRLMTGYLLGPDGLRRVADAKRDVVRDPRGRPVRVEIAGVTEDGASFEVAGEAVSRMAMPSTPWFNWVTMMRWTLPDGSEGFGEDQETWSPELLRLLLHEHDPVSA